MLEIRTVLCPVDFSVLGEREIRLAGDICQHYGARLVIEHNLEPRPPGYLSVTWMWSETHESTEEAKAAAAERRMSELFNKVPSSVPVEGKLSRGPIETAILFLAHEMPVDLIIMGSHGWSTSEHRSITERIVVQAPCPVLTLRDGGTDTQLFRVTETPDGAPWQVVVPTDFSEHSEAAVRYAFDLAEKLPIHLSLVYVESAAKYRKMAAEAPKAQPQWLQEATDRLRRLIPVGLSDRVDPHVHLGRPSEQILILCEKVGAAMVVMGVHAKGVLQKALAGATSRDLLHESSCPVLLVPAAGRTRTRARVAC
jgi:nucleotide-binding universal stress UspA family protein